MHQDVMKNLIGCDYNVQKQEVIATIGICIPEMWKNEVNIHINGLTVLVEDKLFGTDYFFQYLDEEESLGYGH